MLFIQLEIIDVFVKNLDIKSHKKLTSNFIHLFVVCL